jgi:hypothetical protein
MCKLLFTRSLAGRVVVDIRCIYSYIYIYRLPIAGIIIRDVRLHDDIMWNSIIYIIYKYNIIRTRKETYTETAYRTRQHYYCCSRYRVYLRRDLPGKHVIVVKIISRCCRWSATLLLSTSRRRRQQRLRHSRGAEIDAKSETEKEKHRI